MKYCILMLFYLSSCIYDPPLKGKEIIVANQSDEYVYVIDSLNMSTTIEETDTLVLNGRSFVSKRGNSIPKYSNWRYFFSEKAYKTKKEKNATKLTFYFIKQKNFQEPLSILLNQKIYDSIDVNISEIQKNDINLIIYSNDSIEIHHRYDIESGKSKTLGVNNMSIVKL